MIEKEPSRTAFAAAMYRAAHQVVDKLQVFEDPLALTILGETRETVVQAAQAQPAGGGMRFFIAARSRIAEDAIASGIAERVLKQVVVLGAGLDTFAYRSPLSASLRIFEVDFPATQAWKQRRLKETGVTPPANLTFAPVDFERDNLMDALVAAGLQPDQRTFFLWLGVVPYLTREAIVATLTAIARLPGGAEVAFDYSDPPANFPPEMRAMHAERAARVAAIGEPFLSHFEPAELHTLLTSLGFVTIADDNPADLIERFYDAEFLRTLRERGAQRPELGGHVVIAGTA
jgi:methyltransferase (TIGR00027 family)